jgi:hypothetical protein
LRFFVDRRGDRQFAQLDRNGPGHAAPKCVRRRGVKYFFGGMAENINAK